MGKSLEEIQKEDRCKYLADIARDVLKESQAAYWVKEHLDIYAINVRTGEDPNSQSAMVVYSAKNKVVAKKEHYFYDAEKLVETYEARTKEKFCLEKDY